MRSPYVIATEIRQLEVMRDQLVWKISSFGTDNAALITAQINTLRGVHSHLLDFDDEDHWRVIEQAINWLEEKDDMPPTAEWLESPWLFR
jgi:hypothetical protein